jgi:hypothetical protein
MTATMGLDYSEESEAEPVPRAPSTIHYETKDRHLPSMSESKRSSVVGNSTSDKPVSPALLSASAADASSRAVPLALPATHPTHPSTKKLTKAQRRRLIYENHPLAPQKNREHLYSRFSKDHYHHNNDGQHQHEEQSSVFERLAKPREKAKHHCEMEEDHLPSLVPHSTTSAPPPPQFFDRLSTPRKFNRCIHYYLYSDTKPPTSAASHIHDAENQTSADSSHQHHPKRFSEETIKRLSMPKFLPRPPPSSHAHIPAIEPNSKKPLGGSSHAQQSSKNEAFERLSRPKGWKGKQQKQQQQKKEKELIVEEVELDEGMMEEEHDVETLKEEGVEVGATLQNEAFGDEAAGKDEGGEMRGDGMDDRLQGESLEEGEKTTEDNDVERGLQSEHELPLEVVQTESRLEEVPAKAEIDEDKDRVEPSKSTEDPNNIVVDNCTEVAPIEDQTIQEGQQHIEQSNDRVIDQLDAEQEIPASSSNQEQESATQDEQVDYQQDFSKVELESQQLNDNANNNPETSAGDNTTNALDDFEGAPEQGENHEISRTISADVIEPTLEVKESNQEATEHHQAEEVGAIAEGEDGETHQDETIIEEGQAVVNVDLPQEQQNEQNEEKFQSPDQQESAVGSPEDMPVEGHEDDVEKQE